MKHVCKSTNVSSSKLFFRQQWLLLLVLVFGLVFVNQSLARLLPHHQAFDLVLASDNLGYICSVERDALSNATILLQQVSLPSGTLGPAEVVNIIPAVSTFNGPKSSSTSCSIHLALDQDRIVVAYDQSYKPSLPQAYPGVSVKDTTLGTWTHRHHHSINDPLLQAGPFRANLEYGGMKILELNGIYMFLYNTLPDNVGINAEIPTLRFASIDDLVVPAPVMLSATTALFPNFDSFPQQGSIDYTVDQTADELAIRYIKIGSSNFGFNTISIDSAGNYLETSRLNYSAIQAPVPLYLLGAASSRAFVPEYFNTATNQVSFLALLPPFVILNYRLSIMVEPAATALILEDSSDYYESSVFGHRPVSKLFGFPFTMDALLSSNDQWVVVSRDFQTQQLALHRIDPTFTAVQGSHATIEPGTQLDRVFCGTPSTEDYGSLRLPGLKNQNNFVTVVETPTSQELVIAHLTCPTGILDDAELVVTVVPLEFPTLVDDVYVTTRGQRMTVAAPGVLGNDLDITNGTLSLFQQPAGGQVQLQADGSFSYTPNPSTCGPDVITYAINQGSTQFLARATINIACDAELHWTFDEIDSSTAPVNNDRVTDYSGGHRHGYVVENITPTGPTLVSGSLLSGSSQALNLSTAEDTVVFEDGYINFNDQGFAAGGGNGSQGYGGNDLNFSAADSFTIEAIIRVSTPLLGAQIVGKTMAGAFTTRWVLNIQDNVAGGGESVTGFLVDDIGQIAQVDGNINIDDGLWHHIALVRDTTAGTLSLYIDYQLNNSSVDNTGDIINNTAPVELGVSSGMEIDELRVVRAALSPEQFVFSTPALSVAANVSLSEGDAGTTIFTFTVDRIGAVTSGTSSVDYAVSGTGLRPADANDFFGAFPSGTINFAAGETQTMIDIEISGDVEVERDETFILELFNPIDALTNANYSAIGTILTEEDFPPEIFMDGFE